MKITVIKQNTESKETWRYSGDLLEQTEDHLVLEAFFDREDRDFHGMCLCRGDRFVETYYFERWYNVFEIYDRVDGRLKGWYCNIASPAIVVEGIVAYRDLALDLLVFPDGRQIILDEDEFADLRLSPSEHKLALAALAELQADFLEKLKAA